MRFYEGIIFLNNLEPGADSLKKEKIVKKTSI